MEIKKYIQEYTNISDIDKYKILNVNNYHPKIINYNSEKKKVKYFDKFSFRSKMKLSHCFEMLYDRFIFFGIDFDEKIILYVQEIPE